MQKMTRRVSAYIPKKITSWLSSTNEEQNGPEQPHIETPSNSAPPTVQIPPAKRLKTDLNAVVPHTVPFPCTINYPSKFNAVKPSTRPHIKANLNFQSTMHLVAVILPVDAPPVCHRRFC